MIHQAKGDGLEVFDTRALDTTVHDISKVIQSCDSGLHLAEHLTRTACKPQCQKHETYHTSYTHKQYQQYIRSTPIDAMRP